MKKDIEAGGFHLKKFLDENIKEQEKKHAHYIQESQLLPLVYISYLHL
jgi:hypothetical protein